MGMSHPAAGEEPDRRYVRHSREYLASQQWTADRVRAELVDEQHPAPRYEFIDGVLLVSPSPGFLHQRAVMRLAMLLWPYLERHAIGAVSISPSDVEVEPASIAQPDVYVVPATEAERLRAHGTSATPARVLLLAVEVVSPSSRRTDRLRKRRYYARAGVPDYWVLDLDDRAFEVSRAGADTVTIVEDVLVWQPGGAAEPFVLDVRAFFDEVLGPDPMRPDGPEAAPLG
jgi:Uma2 family endonuclease